MRTLASLSTLLLLSAPASAVTIDWTPVGSPGNAADNTGYGAIEYSYNVIQSNALPEPLRFTRASS